MNDKYLSTYLARNGLKLCTVVIVDPNFTYGIIAFYINPWPRCLSFASNFIAQLLNGPNVVLASYENISMQWLTSPAEKRHSLWPYGLLFGPLILTKLRVWSHKVDPLVVWHSKRHWSYRVVTHLVKVSTQLHRHSCRFRYKITLNTTVSTWIRC